jgi:hypothetical protein
MAGYFARDKNILATCFAVLQGKGGGNRSASTTALRIIGQQFGGDRNVRETLEKILPRRKADAQGASNDLLLALCYGWPLDPIVERFRGAPLKDWRGLDFEVACHICRVTDNSQRMGDVVSQAIRGFSGRKAYGVESFVSALRLWTAGTGRDEMLESWLKDESPSKVVTAVSLLSLTGPVSGERRVLFEDLFNRELSESRPPRVGMDMTVGVRRPIADALYEAVIGSQKSSHTLTRA